MQRLSHKLVLLFSILSMLLAPMPGLMAMPMMLKTQNCDNHLIKSSQHNPAQNHQVSHQKKVTDDSCHHCKLDEKKCLNCDCNHNGCHSGKIQLLNISAIESSVISFDTILPGTIQNLLISINFPPLLRPPIR